MQNASRAWKKGAPGSEHALALVTDKNQTIDDYGGAAPRLLEWGNIDLLDSPKRR